MLGSIQGVHESRLVTHLDLAQFYLGHAIHALEDACSEADEANHHQGKWGCRIVAELTKTTQSAVLRMCTDYRAAQDPSKRH